ncbi:5-formyltetrahydrofolate cyclo-ligase [Paenibacillus eucommiae]|uniref:5-formyltetrahydrofolate cyclo-ligase n=1 Tax=Paenibacillus eucommiae TaxID=1355755 RepID=A0ABS4J568_9BACL|nr:5-formyltetrahydrofolate cyclo-ligase [Paenibacillus eucommiae]MBP1994992.1 5-formyltetrahydrofolate cyclo-ligase [Paenibacillus eucommiae]
MNIRERKIELRKELEAKRSLLTPDIRSAKQAIINEQLIELGKERLLAHAQNLSYSPTLSPSPDSLHPDGGGEDGTTVKQMAPTVLTYMPFRSEADITPFMEWCWQEGVRVLLPRVVKETRSLNLHAVSSYEDVEGSLWGIREPKAELPVEHHIEALSMILVPGLAFDKAFGRLGYGGGFYDRFIQLFAARGLAKPYLVAAAFDLQIVEQVPVSWHDFRVDGLITETLELHQA